MIHREKRIRLCIWFKEDPERKALMDMDMLFDRISERNSIHLILGLILHLRWK